MKEINLLPGEFIGDATKRLVEAAPAFMVFNGTRVEAQPGDTAGDVYQRWGEAREKAQREYEATDEYKEQKRQAEIRRTEEARVREEALAKIQASGVREQFSWSEGMGEISGFGGGYEQACRDMLYAGLAWLKDKPGADLSIEETEDVRAIEKVIVTACPDCTGAMHGAVMNALAFIHMKGWAEYAKVMTERTAQRAP